jgi:hypothetical protein
MFTPNTSHFLQPLDDLLFSTFKTTLKKTQEELDGSFAFFQLKMSNSLCCCISTSFKKAFSPRAIRSAFANVGIWSYSHETILANAQRATEKQIIQHAIENFKLPLEKEVIRLVMAVQQKSFQKVQSLVSSGLIINVQPKTVKPCHNSATMIFEKTGGRHDALLEHERKETQKKINKEVAKEQRKRAREIAKEKEENEELIEESEEQDEILEV